MEHAHLIDTLKPVNVLSFLKDRQSGKSDLDIIISSQWRDGIIHKRNGDIVGARTGDLSGNGAFMTLTALEGADIRTELESSSLQKTVSVSIIQAEHFFARHKSTAPALSASKEEQLFRQAKQLFFMFRYKQASDKLISILRSNRFYYPAWLWQSRIITRRDHISKAMSEASRWGNHDPDIWRESRKIQPHLTAEHTEVKRCFFCWCPLEKGVQCPHCHAFLAITSQPQSTLLRQDEITASLTMYKHALLKDQQNSRIAYALAVGCFNLQDYIPALEYMRLAQKSAPQSPLYRKSLALLTTVAKTQRPQPTAPPTASSLPPASRANRKPAYETAPSQAVAPPLSAQAAYSGTLTQRPAAVSGNGRAQTIFVVEDSPTSRKVLKMILGRGGFQVEEAATGTEALKMAQTIQPALVLLDIMLPDMTGYDILPKIKKINHLQDVPVIMLTGKKKPTDRMKGMLLGSNEYITKPFNPEKLLQLIGNYV